MLAAEQMPYRTDRRTVLEVPWRTIFKLIAGVALVWLWLELYQLFLVLLVAVLLAVTLDPLVAWVERRGLSRWAAATVVSVALLIVVGGFLWFTWSSLKDQAQYVGRHIREIERQVSHSVPPWLQQMADAVSNGNATSTFGDYAVRFVRSLASAVVVALVGFILTIYLLIEGRRTYAWLMAFVPRGERPHADQTARECRTVIFGYVAGNVATSIFATVFVLVSLSILDVPAALLLAVLAGVMDFIPVMGFILSAVPAVLLAATISARTALIVAALYVLYHGAENYLIAPRVYGDRLKLSNVAVILAFAVGAALAGVIGALIALPLAAVYPAIERIWLREHLGAETVREHRTIEKRAS